MKQSSKLKTRAVYVSVLCFIKVHSVVLLLSLWSAAFMESLHFRGKWPVFSSPSPQKPLLQVGYGSSSSLPARWTHSWWREHISHWQPPDIYHEIINEMVLSQSFFISLISYPATKWGSRRCSPRPITGSAPPSRTRRSCPVMCTSSGRCRPFCCPQRPAAGQADAEAARWDLFKCFFCRSASVCCKSDIFSRSAHWKIYHFCSRRKRWTGLSITLSRWLETWRGLQTEWPRDCQLIWPRLSSTGSYTAHSH